MCRDYCIACGEKLSKEPIFSHKNMPGLSQNLPLKDELDFDKPVEYRLYQCTGCGLVQFNCDPVSYYKDSTRAGERCEVLTSLRRIQYKHFIEKYDLFGKKIIEIGAGKGGFLKTLKEMTEYDVREYGIEHNAEFVRIARNQEGVNVVQGDPEESELKIQDAPFDAFMSFAYPARLIYPNNMFRNIYNNTTDNAVGIIQVPSMEHLLKAGGFFDITRDHIAYYDEASLKFILQKNGFEVLEFGEVSEIYIYAIVRKRKMYPLRELWDDVDSFSEMVYKSIVEMTKDKKSVAVWCAGHFAFTVLSLSNIGKYIEYIIDNAKFKQGCFSPATHIPIYGPEHFKSNPVDIIIIMGPIYTGEIINEIREKCGKQVKVYTISKLGLMGIE